MNESVKIIFEAVKFLLQFLEIIAWAGCDRATNLCAKG